MLPFLEDNVVFPEVDVRVAENQDVRRAIVLRGKVQGCLTRRVFCGDVGSRAKKKIDGGDFA